MKARGFPGNGCSTAAPPGWSSPRPHQKDFLTLTPKVCMVMEPELLLY